MTNADGFLVTFEGTDGTGKSTLISHVESRLDADVETVGEFSQGPLGEELRRLLTEDKYLEVEKQGLTVVSMIVADHFYQVENEILPALTDGKVVLKDRYLETLQACEPRILENDYGFEELAQEYVDTVESLTPLVPDLTLYLTLPREVQRQRLQERGEDAVDETVLDERETVYRQRAEECSDRIVTHENDASVEQATEDVTDIIRKRLG
jgi:dTMP kinase